MLTLDEARAELARIEAVTEIGMCRRHVQHADREARLRVPDYFKGGRPHREYLAVRWSLQHEQANRARATEERKARKQQRSAAMLLARLRKVRGANDPEWGQIAEAARRLAAAILATLLLSTSAQAADGCGPYERATTVLRSQYGEELRWTGVTAAGTIAQLWSSERSWTILEVAPNRRACIIGTGKGEVVAREGRPL